MKHADYALLLRDVDTKSALRRLVRASEVVDKGPKHGFDALLAVRVDKMV